MTSVMKRRDFLRTSAAVGGGLLISLYIPELALSRNTDAAAPTPTPATFTPNAFIRIGVDDSVTIIVGKAEMGQGVYTSLPMLVAEELEADWSKIKVESAPVDAAYNHTVFGIQMTGGSTSTASEWERMRKAGATARVMLIAAAAQSWNVAPDSLRAEKGNVIHVASGRFGRAVRPDRSAGKLKIQNRTTARQWRRSSSMSPQTSWYFGGGIQVKIARCRRWSMKSLRGGSRTGPASAPLARSEPCDYFFRVFSPSTPC